MEGKKPIWLTIKGIKLSEKLEILLNPKSWLMDDHIHAAEHLLKSMDTGVSGLNDIVLMMHFKKTKVDLATKEGQTVQFHNIANHWAVFHHLRMGKRLSMIL